MSNRTSFRIAIAAVAVVGLVGLSACGKKDSNKDAAPAANESGSGETSSTVTPTTKASSSATIPGSAKGDTVQWASTASATTSYGAEPADSWSANQAIGAPDVTGATEADECGDIGQAWASAARDTVDTLTLGYTKAVIPTGVNIRETYNPGSIVKVVVSGAGGKSSTVYEGQPAVGATCPTYLVIQVTGVDFPVSSVAISLDQTQVQNWSEIDAVQLVGNLPSGSGTTSTSTASSGT